MGVTAAVEDACPRPPGDPEDEEDDEDKPSAPEERPDNLTRQGNLNTVIIVPPLTANVSVPLPAPEAESEGEWLVEVVSVFMPAPEAETLREEAFWYREQVGSPAREVVPPISPFVSVSTVPPIYPTATNISAFEGLGVK